MAVSGWGTSLVPAHPDLSHVGGTMTRSKIGIVGAGAVGTSTAFACLSGGVAREIALYDLNAEKVRAEYLDFAHGSMFFEPSSVRGSHDIEVLRDSDIVIMTAGAKPKPGQSRLDVATTNAEILRAVIPAVLEVAPQAIFILVTNPCDVLTVIAQEISGLPRERVISAGTLLDTARLRWLLAHRAGGIAESSIHAHVIGEHGDTSFPLWSQASIGPVPVSEFTLPDGTKPFAEHAQSAIAQEVREAGWAIVQAKGTTNSAIGLASARIARATLRDERVILPLSIVLEGEWGLSGVALSVPTVVGRAGIEQVLDLPITDAERAALERSATAIRAAVAKVRQ